MKERISAIWAYSRTNFGAGGSGVCSTSDRCQLLEHGYPADIYSQFLGSRFSFSDDRYLTIRECNDADNFHIRGERNEKRS